MQKLTKTLLAATILTSAATSYQLFNTTPSRSIASDSAVVFDAPTQIDIAAVQEKIKELMAIKMEDVDAADFDTSDYDAVALKLKAESAKEIAAYIETLDLIRQDVIASYSVLKKLDQMLKQNNTKIMQADLQTEVLKVLKETDAKINARHQNILGQMYSFGGNLISDTIAPDSIKECKSISCVRSVANDLITWRKFVDTLNKDASFIDFQDKKIETMKDNVVLTPTIALGLLEGAQRVLDFGIEENTKYSIPALIGEAILDGVKGAEAVGMAFAAVPVGVAEMSVNGLKLLSSLKFYKEGLGLEKLDVKSETLFGAELEKDVETLLKNNPSLPLFVNDVSANEEVQIDFIRSKYTKHVVLEKTKFLGKYFGHRWCEALVNSDLERTTKLLTHIHWDNAVVCIDNRLIPNLEEKRQVYTNLLILEDVYYRSNLKKVLTWGVNEMERSRLKSILFKLKTNTDEKISELAQKLINDYGF